MRFQALSPRITQNNPLHGFLSYKEEIKNSIDRVLDSGFYILGEEVSSFEHEWATWLSVGYSVGCASGTDALELVLRSLDLPSQARVLTPSHTAVATVAAIVRAGYRPFFADIDASSFCIDPDSVVRCIDFCNQEGDPISALIAVHLYGNPCDIKCIKDISDNYNIPLIEDVSQAHGSSWEGKSLGTFGVAGAFSLYPTKNLGGIGDAGIICTSSGELEKKLKVLRQYGWVDKGISQIPGINSRLDPIQAAILRVKLKYLEKSIEHRRSIAEEYSRHLNPKSIKLPPLSNEIFSCSHHQYVIKVEKSKRDNLKSYLFDQGIDTLIHYPKAAHQMPAYQDKDWVGADPNGLLSTELIIPEILSLPMGEHIEKRHVEEIANRINYFIYN